VLAALFNGALLQRLTDPRSTREC